MKKQKKKQYRGAVFSQDVSPSVFLTEDCFAVHVNRESLNMRESKKEKQP